MKITANQFVLTLTALFFIGVGIYAAGVLVAVNSSDGTEKFEGDEKLAAVEAINEKKEYYSQKGQNIIRAAGTYNYKVESVKEVFVPDSGRYRDCEKLFEIKIAKVGLFGVVGEWSSPYICKFKNSFGTS